MLMIYFLVTLTFADAASTLSLPLPQPSGPRVCIVKPAANETDSAPAILGAFRRCGHDGKVIFRNSTYMIKSVMTTTSLRNCEVDLQGILLWDTNIPYWLNNSLPVGYQNHSTAWRFGGNNITFRGHGYGTLNGNGNVWYENIRGGNFPGRPHQITFTNITNSVIEGLRFINSQMWTMTIIHANNVLLQDIYVNSTRNKGGSMGNTDGANTIYANNITLRRWSVKSGDDNIAIKANSTNILLEDMEFHRGGGLAIGSIGQYKEVFETIENVTARNFAIHNSYHAAYIKTWTGVQKGYPPNGGGGGLGYAKSLDFTNFTLYNTSGIFSINQCTSYNGQTGDCNTSKFNINNVKFTEISGTVSTSTVASLRCSKASPCHDIEINNIDLVSTKTGEKAAQYNCANVVNPKGFKCND